MNPTLEFAQWLPTQVASLVFGTNLFEGPASETAVVDAVFVRSFGGLEPERHIQSNSQELRQALVNVEVRGRSQRVASDLAIDILNAANGTRGPAGFLRTSARQSTPTDGGKDDASRFIYRVTFLLVWAEDAA